MSEFKGTSGPWNFYDDRNDGKTNRIEIVATGKTVARIYHSVTSEDLPNARLIATAPELLAALKTAAEVIGHPEDSFSVYMRELIAKATGAA